MVRKYNKKVGPREFEEGDLVLRKMELQRKPHGERKVSTKLRRTLSSHPEDRKRSLQIAELAG